MGAGTAGSSGRLEAARLLRAESRHPDADRRVAEIVRKQRSTAALASTSWLLRATSGDVVEGRRAVAIVAKRSPGRGARDDSSWAIAAARSTNVAAVKDPRSYVGTRLGDRNPSALLLSRWRGALRCVRRLGSAASGCRNRTNLAVGQHWRTSLPSRTSASGRRRSSRSVSPSLRVSSNSTAAQRLQNRRGRSGELAPAS